MAMAEQDAKWQGDAADESAAPRNAKTYRTADIVAAGLKGRYRAEKRFQLYGMLAIGFSLVMLVIFFATILGNGLTAFRQTYVTLDVTLDRAVLDPSGSNDPARIAADANWQAVARAALLAQFPDVTSRGDRRELGSLLSDGAGYTVRDAYLADPSRMGQSIRVDVLADDDFDMIAKGHVDRSVPEAQRRVNDQKLGWWTALEDKGMVSKQFNTILLTKGDSRQAEQAGLWGAVVGSFYTLIITLSLAFPVGVAAAIYLEEYAPKNRLTDLIEVNINNLAAVPSIVFGLLGLAVFLQFFGLPRSAPIVGALVLALIVLPTIIISGRAALKSVPPSIREAALGLGASKLQMIVHHVLPLAMPGMLTGTIIGMAHALGETAPLLMIGMVAFVADVPATPVDPSTVLPVQVYLWADSPERAFTERTSAAIIVLLAFLILMNSAAIWLRKKFERRW